MSVHYVVNGELTENAHLTPELIQKCTLNVGAPAAIKINDSEAGNAKSKGVPPVQYYQKFVEISYPNGEKSASAILPGCVIHHSQHNYYGKPSVFIAVPQSIVTPMRLKLSNAGHSPQFQDKRILSDSKYWWTRFSADSAEEGKEFIRMFDDEGEIYYGGFDDLFAEFPTSMLCNITCTIKLKGEAPAGQPLTGNEEWRVGLSISMITPYDAIEVDPPSSGTGQRSIAGKADKMKPGLAKFKKAK